jgi:hypothetical protein
MSIAKAQLAADRDGKGKRGSTNNGRRLDSFQKRVGTTAGDWGGCDAQRLQDVVVAITELGGAVTIGLSRDRGAHSITLLLDGERETLWFNGNADLDAELDNVLGALAAMQ